MKCSLTITHLFYICERKNIHSGTVVYDCEEQFFLAHSKDKERESEYSS